MSKHLRDFIKSAWVRLRHILIVVGRIFQHIEVEHVGVFFGFVTLGLTLPKEYGKRFRVVLGIVGLLLVWKAARNAYMRKSTELADKYEERFFERMSCERKSAALYLLGENPSSDELEDVLDFFESPIGEKVEDGSLDPKQVYVKFYHWIRLYFQASQKFIEEYRKDEPAAYTSLAGLYRQTSEYEKREIKRESGRRCEFRDLSLSKEDLTEYLRQEARLKTDSSDWERIFHPGE